MVEKEGESVTADFLFEASWEVCNKVGGIYTVIKTKVPQMQKRYGRNYILIGPYFHENVKGEFEESLPPEHCRAACAELRNAGIVAHYGTWLTEGNPTAILIDFQSFFAKKDEIKGKLWESFGIDSLNSGFEFDEPVVWSWAVGVVIEQFISLNPGRNFSAVFHEWLTGAALLYLKTHGCKVGKVFVTHATVLGRALASDGKDIYCHRSDGKCLLDSTDFDKEAYSSKVHSKHQLEKAAAQNADVFSTVSEITAMEAGRVLGKSPDIVVPNGLDIGTFPTTEDLSIMHRAFRNKIRHFLLSYFFPYYQFDIGETLIYFIAARYELRDKGIDVFIRALGKLNDRLKQEGSKKNIVAFFWVPAGVRGISHSIIQNRMLFKDIEESLKDNEESIMWRILNSIVADKSITKENLFSDEIQSELKRKVLKFKREDGHAPLCTHDLSYSDDPILRLFGECGLSNAKTDRVKVIFYPTYLTGADNLLDLSYYEAIQGSHLGIFPSFYEPWGYTPLESGALGVASVTSDLAGFGRHILRQESYRSFGIRVIERMDRTEEQVTESLFKVLYDFAALPKKVRVESKLEARRLASLADWELLCINYFDAHNLAVRRALGK